MAIEVPLLAIDSGGSVTYLANHDASVDYQVIDMRFPAPRLKPEVKRAQELGREVGGSEWHQPALRTIELYCVGDDAEDALLMANDLYEAASGYGADLWTRHEDTHHTLKTTIRSAEMSEPVYDNVLRSAYKVRVTLSLVTDPYWRDESAATDFSGTVTNSPGTTTVNSVPGEVPAITSITATAAQATSRIIVGLEADPHTDFTPTQTDFSGDTDISGSCVDSSCQKISFTAADAWTDLGAAANLDVNAHRGTYLVEARVSTTGDASSTDYRVSDETTGSGIGVTTATYTDSVTASKTSGSGAENVLFGPVVLPSGGVPNTDTGIGFGAASNVINQNSQDASISSVDETNIPGQTFTLAIAGIINSITWYLKMENWTGGYAVDCFVYKYNTGPNTLGDVVDSGQIAVSGNFSAAAKTATGFGTVSELAAGVYCAVLVWAGTGDLTGYYKSGGSSYAGGDRVSSSSWGPGTVMVESPTEDLYFILSEKATLGFNANIQLQGRCASANQSGYIDTVIIYSTGYGCVTATSTFSANQGFLWDGCNRPIDRNVYLADNSGGIASSILADCEVYGSLLLRPGSNTLVAGAHTPYNAVPGAITITGTYTPRYITAGRGE